MTASLPRKSSAKETLFTDALALPPAERHEFLVHACGANAELHAELLALLAAHADPASLLTGSQPTLAARGPEERPGDWIGRYRLLQQIGEGGCGVVWMAEQEEPVRRKVAVKVIKLGMDTRSVIARFEAERQALAMMDHANIAKVFDAGSTGAGRPFFVMELVRGTPITKYCDESHLSPRARLELFVKVCLAVQHAHQKGIIHRDLKPSNILVTVNDGQPTPKVIDFGIAKATHGRLTDATLFTAFEQFIGTPAYMSPEQAELSSLDIDTRSDVYSLGVLLYELLTGRLPFDPKSFVNAGVDQIRQHIRETEPPRPSTRWRTLAENEQTKAAGLRGTLPAALGALLRGDLDWIVMRCLEKDRARRYETANGIAMDIERHLRHEPVVARPPSTAYLLQKLIRRHRFGFAAAGIVLGVIVIGAIATATQATRALRAEREQNELREAARQAQAKETATRRASEEEQLRNEKQRWARQHILPEIDRLMKAQDNAGAFTQALEAEKYLPDDPALIALWPRLSVVTTVESTPAGASVYWKPYLKPKAEWQLLGKTPLKDIRLARDYYRWQIKMEGHAPLERAGNLQPNNRIVRFSLDKSDLIPSGMVRVAGEQTAPTAAETEILVPARRTPRPPQVGTFFIDRYEVTNRQFREFVDRGGYTKAEWWKPPFIKEGKELPWSEAIAGFRDATGRPGPATWTQGSYPAGEDEYPVSGISWFEAAAYAESVGKRLPSIHHWNRATAWSGEYVVRLSNFSGQGPAPVGTFQGMCIWGAYDMAGNVKEWCWNEAEPGRRYILGGGSREPVYMFVDPDAQSPWDRSAANGFRCISLQPDANLAPEVDAPEIRTANDFTREQPVSDDVFRAFQALYSYKKEPLDSRTESVDESAEAMRVERVSFTAAYGDERVPAVIYLPKTGSPPYQTVIFFPGTGAFNQRQRLEAAVVAKFVVESGRAMVQPIYKGMYGRGEGTAAKYLDVPNIFPDFVVACAKDLGRTIDYLETRPDMRADKIGYLGFSLGARLGVVLPAVENRLKAAVLVSGGMTWQVVAPQVDQINFAPRIKIPTLMLNGRFDFTFPGPSQRQMFRLLGAPEEHKRHVLLDVGHGITAEQMTKDTLDWLDRYLGPVR